MIQAWVRRQQREGPKEPQRGRPAVPGGSRENGHSEANSARGGLQQEQAEDRPSSGLWKKGGFETRAYISDMGSRWEMRVASGCRGGFQTRPSQSNSARPLRARHSTPVTTSCPRQTLTG